MVTATRQIEGITLPPAGVWEADTYHSSVDVVARHMMVAKVRGTFGGFSARINIADAPEDSSVEVSIDPATIDTGIGQRDDHLRSADFFDAATYPEITFRSTRLEPGKGTAFKLHGDLTVRDITRPVVLDAQFDGVATGPDGALRAGFSASTEIDREAWGMTWNQAIGAGGVLVGKKIKVEIQIEAVRSETDQA